MCTIALVFGIASSPLVIAANRDELYDRPASGPRVLDERTRTVGGVDLRSGGTWLAVRPDGRFAAVTNQRALAASPSGVRSRGHAVRELAAAEDPEAYIAALDPHDYASMNLAWGDASRVSIAYVRHDPTSLTIERLAPGIHVLCNDRLGAPDFPRGERLAATIASVATLPWPRLSARLALGLSDHTHALEHAVAPSHLPPELARELTATCIHTPSYGTRSSTLLAIDHGLRARVSARRWPAVRDRVRRSHEVTVMTDPRPRKLVVAGLIIDDDTERILITQRRADQSLPLQWEFPGGKVEPGESPVAALARELAEEIGADAEVGLIWDVLFHAYPDFDLVMLVYAVRLREPTAARAVEVADLAWVRIDGFLDAYDVLPADRPCSSTGFASKERLGRIDPLGEGCLQFP